MSFNKGTQRLFRDILDAIKMIELFTAEMGFEQFRSNPMAVAAVERKLLVISEAATRLGSEAERLVPDQPWRNIRGIGNHLRHAYDRLELDMVWRTVADDLPSLKSAMLLTVEYKNAPPENL